MWKCGIPHWRIQGGHHQHTPQLNPILSFLHLFLPKSTPIRGQHPPNGSVPPPPNGKSWIRHCSIPTKLITDCKFTPKRKVKSNVNIYKRLFRLPLPKVSVISISVHERRIKANAPQVRLQDGWLQQLLQQSHLGANNVVTFGTRKSSKT